MCEYSEHQGKHHGEHHGKHHCEHHGEHYGEHHGGPGYGYGYCRGEGPGPGRHFGPGGQFRRRFPTREERIAGLEEYLKALQAEAKAVEELITEMKAR